MPATVYLIPTVLDPEGLDALPPAVLKAVQQCEVFFAEQIRTARRFLKSLWPEMVIDNYAWFSIDRAEQEQLVHFKKALQEGRVIGIISEAGCPGVADPGQLLVQCAQEAGARVLPVTGPSSILLALMASGMNGQQFEFRGYLPIEQQERIRKIRELEQDAQRKNSTQIFIETPYRNNQLINDMLSTLNGNTRLCVAVDITSASEFIKTKFIKEWKQQPHDFHKRPAIFLLQA